MGAVKNRPFNTNTDSNEVTDLSICTPLNK